MYIICTVGLFFVLPACWQNTSCFKYLSGMQQIMKRLALTIIPVTFCSVLNKLTLQKSKIKMKYSKKQYNYYSDDERMSYIREYLSSPESKSEFCKRHGFCAKLLTYWLNKYQIEDKDMGRSSKPVNSDAIDSSISELQKELSLLRAENRKLHRALADESLRHEACEELINLAESTYHIKVRKNSDAK